MMNLELVEVDMLKETTKSSHTSEQYAVHRKYYLSHHPPPIASSSDEELTEFVKKYLVAMKNKQYSSSYINIARAAIKHYYKNQKPKPKLDWEIIDSVMPDKNMKYSPIGPTHDDIKKLLEISDEKFKAIILTLSSTGMRREALCQVKLTDMLWIPEYKIYRFTVYPGDPKHEYITFCTSEAGEAIQIFLRKKYPGIDVYLRKQGYLKNLYLLPGKKAGHHMNASGLSSMLRKKFIAAGIGEKMEINMRDKKPAAHGFKHFAITQMTIAKVDYAMRCMMTDHQGKLGVGNRYIDKKDEMKIALLQEYVTKAAPQLTIYEKYKPIVLNETSSDVEELKRENQELREQIATITKALLKNGLIQPD